MNERLVVIRTQQIVDARKKIDEEKNAIVVDRETFLKSFFLKPFKDKNLSSDNSDAACLGYADNQGNVYYSPIENFTQEDIELIEKYRKLSFCGSENDTLRKMC